MTWSRPDRGPIKQSRCPLSAISHCLDIWEMQRIIFEKILVLPIRTQANGDPTWSTKVNFFLKLGIYHRSYCTKKCSTLSVLILFRFTKFLLTKKNMYCNISPNCLIRSVWRFWKRHFKQNFSKKFNSGVFYANCKDWCLFHCLKTSIYYHTGKKTLIIESWTKEWL